MGGLRRGFTLSLLWLFFVGKFAAQEQGTITGTVVDERGAPLSGAKVSTELVSLRPGRVTGRISGTDSEGHFRLSGLAFGEYKVFAKKEEIGYPDQSWSFYSDGLYVTVTLTAAAPSAALKIQLGPKSGLLKGSVTNAVTGAPVNAGFKLARATSPGKWISASVASEYRVLLPPNTDVLLEVSAPGFKTWTPGFPLRLQVGAEMHLDVPLEPSYDPNARPSKFLVPDGYVGWVQLEYDVREAQTSTVEGDVTVFKFPEDGVLITSSPGPQRNGRNEFMFYFNDGSERELPMDYRGGRALIWGQYDGSKGGRITLFGFFVGSEDQYKKYQSRANRPGRITNP